MNFIYQGGLEDYIRRDLNQALSTSFNRKNIAITAPIAGEYLVSPKEDSEYHNPQQLVTTRFDLTAFFGAIKPQVKIPEGCTLNHALWMALRQYGIYEAEIDDFGLITVAQNGGEWVQLDAQDACPWVIGGVLCQVNFLGENDIPGYINCYTPPRFIEKVSGLDISGDELKSALYNSESDFILSILLGLASLMTNWDDEPELRGNQPDWAKDANNLTYVNAAISAINSDDPNGPVGTYQRFNDRGYFTFQFAFPASLGEITRPDDFPASMVLQWCDISMRDTDWLSPGGN